MGWINIGCNRYINVSHIVKITFYENNNVYEIVLDNGEQIRTTVLLVNLGIKDIVSNAVELPF